MLGAIVGDVVGSRFEFDNIKTKDFHLFSILCTYTDDTVMTLAVAKSLMEANEDYSDLDEITVDNLIKFGREYPNAGYGGRFQRWIFGNNHEPYNSFGNGSAMRVSPCAYVGKTLEEAIKLSHIVTKVTHDHPEGIKGADATVSAIYLAKEGKSREEIKKYIEDNYYKLDFTLDEIREDYVFHVDCMESVPQAIEAFLESNDFEDAIRNAISIGGDSDTIGAITGSIAEAYYKGVPEIIKRETLSYLDENQKRIINKFKEKYHINNA